MNNRDNFKTTTKEVLPKRVGYLCSNPNCRKSTIGANNNKNKSTSIGVAAHISAASSGGPRYNGDLSLEQRIHIDNAIWLCNNCSVMIDKDEINYPVELLKSWKIIAEFESIKLLNGLIKTNTVEEPFLEADLIYKNGGRYNQGYSYNNPIEMRDGEKVMIAGNYPIIHWEIEWKFNFAIYNNSKYPAYNVSIDSVGEEHFNYIDKIKNINNIPPFQNIDLVAKFTQHFEGRSYEADEIMNKRIPEKFERLILNLKYSNEQRLERTTILTIKNAEVQNNKASH